MRMKDKAAIDVDKARIEQLGTELVASAAGARPLQLGCGRRLQRPRRRARAHDRRLRSRRSRPTTPRPRRSWRPGRATRSPARTGATTAAISPTSRRRNEARRAVGARAARRRRATRCCSRGRARGACRRSPRSGRRISLPAFAAAMQEHLGPRSMRSPLRTKPPTFENTIAALDRSGRRLDADRLPLPQPDLERDLAARCRRSSARWRRASPPTTARCTCTRGLFARIDALHRGARGELGLTGEQRRVLERYHLDFVRAGARCRRRSASTRYADAHAAAGRADDAIRPERARRRIVVPACRCATRPTSPACRRSCAPRRARPPPSAASTMPAWSRCRARTSSRSSPSRSGATCASRPGAPGPRAASTPGRTTTAPVAAEILALRLEQARMHGYASYADYALADTMAGSRAARHRAADAGLAAGAGTRRGRARRAAGAGAVARRAGPRSSRGTGASMPRRCARCATTSTRRRSSPTSRSSAWSRRPSTAPQRLFGLRFVARPEIAVYHPDVKVYEVRDASTAAGRPVPARQLRPPDQAQRRLDELVPEPVAQRRIGRRAGAADHRQQQQFREGARPASRRCSASTTRARSSTSSAMACTACSPTSTYERVSGTNVLRDFVELPSQLFEHWLLEPEVLRRHARHHADRRADPRGADRHAARGAPLQPGLRDGALHRVGAGRHGRACVAATPRWPTSSPSSAPSSTASACPPASASTTG